jgi:hypothetical protein
MQIEELKSYILETFEKVNIAESNGDMFFIYDKNDKQPFATIVTQDNEYDNTSNLNREGFYRLNIGLDKETFSPMFGSLTKEKGFEAYLNLGIDFTQENTVLPHPHYGTMYWVCIVNPSKDILENTLKNYLEVAYHKVAKKNN